MSTWVLRFIVYGWMFFMMFMVLRISLQLRVQSEETRYIRSMLMVWRRTWGQPREVVQQAFDALDVHDGPRS